MQIPNEYNPAKSISFSLIILMYISFNVLYASQNPCTSPNYVKAVGQSHDIVTRPNSQFGHERCNDNAISHWLSSQEDNNKWFYLQKCNDMVSKVLSCVTHNHKLFVCYAGYREIQSRGDVRSGTNPVQKKTNRLTEIDLITKIEKEFSTPAEIDNEYPVTDIAQWKKNYYVANQNSVNIYYAIDNNQLELQQHIFPLIAKDDTIRKIFVDSKDNLIIISQKGDIFRYSITEQTCSPRKTIINALIESTTQGHAIHSFAYNDKNNLLLLGCTGFVKAIVLNSDEARACSFNVTPNLSIHTIDTYDNNILFSNVLENPDLGVLQYYNGHLKEKHCCKEKATPKTQWKDCEACVKKEEQWQLSKTEWEKTPITIKQQTPEQILSTLVYTNPPPKPCSHRVCPEDEKNLPDSCCNITILLTQCDVLLKAISNDSQSCNMASLDAQTLQIPLKTYNSLHPDPIIITHTFLDNHFLFIGRMVNSTADIYQFPLQSLDTNTIRSTLNQSVSFRKHNNDGPYVRYVPGNYPLLHDGYENKYQYPIQINRNIQNSDDIIVIKRGSNCPLGHQGQCNDLGIFQERDHFFQFVFDTFVYTKNHNHSNKIENQKTSIKRWWECFSVKKY